MNISSIGSKLAFKSLVVEKSGYDKLRTESSDNSFWKKVEKQLINPNDYRLIFPASDNTDYFVIRTYGTISIPQEKVDDILGNALEEESISYRKIDQELLKEYNLEEQVFYQTPSKPIFVFKKKN